VASRATTRFPVECTEAGTEAAIAELAGWVGITVAGIGGVVVVVVVVAGAAVVVVELLELLEQAVATSASAPSVTAATAFFIPRFVLRTVILPIRPG
jgi:hypothetical protein